MCGLFVQLDLRELLAKDDHHILVGHARLLVQLVVLLQLYVIVRTQQLLNF